MIFPEKSGPFTDSSYAFVVTYEEIGYVKDEDAGKIDYDLLLKSIQEDEKKENEARTKAGYPEIHLVGWAQQPYYDSQRKILHWAKELKFGSEDSDNTLNYEVRILGRKGMISLNAVAKMYSLPLVNQNISKVLSVASFTQGNSYFDFDSKTDKIAVWTEKRYCRRSMSLTTPRMRGLAILKITVSSSCFGHWFTDRRKKSGPARSRTQIPPWYTIVYPRRPATAYEPKFKRFVDELYK
jgi:hypothetical protein